MSGQTTAESVAARAGATRARIEETAERLFRSMGYQKTAVADIARDLGMSPANVYRFFPSKSAINGARLRRMFSRMFELTIEGFFEERRLHDMVNAAMDEHWGVIQRHLAAVTAAIAQVVQDGMAAGEFAAGDAVKEAQTILHTMIPWNHPSLIETCIARKGQSVEDLRAEVADMTEFVLRALRP